ncbi:hypothetical protein [Capnocytophaga stomatis]|uniref:Uncharacterized protein n=1 Tax=Capnocytophaga stomatis TaxID=1848904 RepID=A0ABW8QD95_9FLAO|nr:hypothetical protein [Capnocytophaga stomatis]GIJ94641.1 hypothetical protein CAPN002_18590 [Capnocytophaga stomatis]
MFLVALQQDSIQNRINEKINNAPDAQYEIGIFIGYLLPFVVLVILSYLLYSYMKNRADKDPEMFD